MLKNIIALAVCIVLANSINAQGQSALPSGEKQLSFGLPGYVGLDFALEDFITVGPKLSLGIFDNSNKLKVGAVGDFHLNTFLQIPNNWDAYIGISAGWIFHENNSDEDAFNFGGQIGGRYFWDDSWGLHLEVGMWESVGGGLGVTWRM